MIAKNIHDLGLDIPMVSSHGVANQTFIDLAGEAAEGVVIPTGKLLFPSQIAEDDVQYEVISTFYTSIKRVLIVTQPILARMVMII